MTHAIAPAPANWPHPLVHKTAFTSIQQRTIDATNQLIGAIENRIDELADPAPAFTAFRELAQQLEPTPAITAVLESMSLFDQDPHITHFNAIYIGLDRLLDSDEIDPWDICSLKRDLAERSHIRQQADPQLQETKNRLNLFCAYTLPNDVEWLDTKTLVRLDDLFSAHLRPLERCIKICLPRDEVDTHMYRLIEISDISSELYVDDSDATAGDAPDKVSAFVKSCVRAIGSFGEQLRREFSNS